MRSAGIRDLKNNLSRYIRRLKPGESVAVTDHGRVVAELRAPASGSQGVLRAPLSDRYAQLVAAGVVRSALEDGDPLADWPTARELSLPRGTAAALIDADRGA